MSYNDLKVKARPILLVMLSLSVALQSLSFILSYGYSPCRCVVVAMDDIGDYGSNAVQLAVMNYFISNKLPFTASIVADKIGFGPDSRVLDKIKEGMNSHLFDIGIHGYRHIDYSQLSREEQQQELTKAADRLEELFGKRADIFFPPYNPFNLYTIEALSNLHISVLSTHEYYEQVTENPYTNQTLLPVTGGSELKVSNLGYGKAPVYHVPYNISFLRLQRNGLSGDSLVHEVLARVEDDIARHGFAQIRLHPTDFAQFNATSGKFVNAVDNTKFQQLVSTLHSLDERNIRIAEFTEIYPYRPITYLQVVDYSYLLLVISILLIPYVIFRMVLL